MALRSFVLFCLLLTCSMAGFAQSVSVKKEIVYKDDVPYCKLIKSGGLTPRFSVRNMADEELIVAQFSNEQQRYNVSFIGGGEICYMSGTMGFGKVLAKDLVANNVIAGDKVAAAGERLFLQQHGNGGAAHCQGVITYPSAPVDSRSDNLYSVVERNRTAMLLIFGNTLSQDNKTIGSYSVQNTSANGKLVKVFSFLLTGGEKIADGYVEGINAKTCRLVILKNNQVVNVGIRTSDDMGQAKEIAAYLVERYFL